MERRAVFFPVIIFVVVLADFVVGGLISNGFIVKVIINEWILYKCFTANEQLLLSLSISNFTITILMLISFFLQNQVNSYTRIQTSFSYSVVVFRSWLTVWLSVFYCIKITTSTHFLFLWCKLRISWLIPRLLVGSAIISFVSIYAFRDILIPSHSNTTATNTSMIQEWRLPQLVDSFKVFFLSAGSACPVLMMVLFSTVAVGSLCRHICRMTGKESRFRNPQTEAHIKAAGTVILLLLFHVSFYMAETISLTINIRTKHDIFVVVLTVVYPPAQAAILVLVNPKLKQAATHILLKISQEQTRHTVCSHI
uniref:Taste receptor type 2 n=1 Tax=Anolis carolinensis TaxID=28377 RepID=A0A803SL84_ANOCA